MFSGIVQGQATLLAASGDTQLRHLCFAFPNGQLSDIRTGASIAINGTCLTVTGYNLEESTANFDAIAETLRLTNLGELVPGDHVNFERAAKFGDEIGGHPMSGHIHSTSELLKIEKNRENCTLYLSVPQGTRAYLLPKGFVGLNGCSLTIGQVSHDHFTIHLIPETLKVTTFGQLKIGDRINLELDSQTQTIVDTVTRILANQTKA